MEETNDTVTSNITVHNEITSYDQAQMKMLKSQDIEVWNNWVVLENPVINLTEADFTGANLLGVKLKDANLTGVFFNGANLSKAILNKATLTKANLESANFSEATLSGANLSNTYLRKTDFTNANFYTADLTGAVLTSADLTGADLTEADLTNADLSGATLINADFTRANFSGVHFENALICDHKKRTGPFLMDAQWLNSHLSEIEEEFLKMRYTGEDAVAKNYKIAWFSTKGKPGINPRNRDTISKAESFYKTATLVNRQLKTALTEQGLEQLAREFAYRARNNERKSFFWSWQKRTFFSRQWFSALGRYFKSWLLNLISGYGFRFRYALLTYLGVIFAFGIIYWIGTGGWFSTWRSFIDAIVESVNIFHGRGIATNTADLLKDTTWLKIVGAIEATVGLVIEVTFIATLTQRLFSK